MNNQPTPILADKVYQDIQAIRQHAPLIHNITNFVVMQYTANTLLALGASPIMAHSKDEIEDIVKISNALVINIGTLDQAWIASMQYAMETAKLKGIPIILDPVGAGASQFRSESVNKLIQAGTPTIIRGNASEIMSIFSSMYTTKGVDSLHKSEYAIDAAKSIAYKNNCTVVVSGQTDICIKHDHQINIHNGHPIMAKVTGMGCTASALIGAFAAVNKDHFLASIHAMLVMGIVGEIAALKSNGPGSFLIHFCDVLYNIDKKIIEENMHVEYIK